jgi:hypothetical protein
VATSAATLPRAIRDLEQLAASSSFLLLILTKRLELGQNHDKSLQNLAQIRFLAQLFDSFA